jgi:hypothetical protein
LLVHTACMLHPSADVTCSTACQAAALNRLARLFYIATDLAAKGGCAVLLGRLWDEWAAMLAAALLAAMHGAQLLDTELPCGTEGGSGGSEDGTIDGDRQQQQQQRQQQQRQQQQRLRHQQQPWERRRLGQAACDLQFVARLLLPPAATGGLHTLQRDSAPRLLNTLAKQCCMKPASIHRYVQVLAQSAVR